MKEGDVVQTKERNYCDRHTTNQFLLAIEVFECLHKHADVFLHNCANVVWSLKGPDGLPLSIMVTFLHKKNPITLQRMQASSILSRTIAIGLTTSQFPPFENTTPITITSLL
jgi:hypothetical protein